MNKFNRITPKLWTDKLSDTIVFYKNTLGFTVNELNEDWGWADLSKDGANIMLAKPNDHEGFKNGDKFTGLFYIGVDDADKLWNELKDKTKVCY